MKYPHLASRMFNAPLLIQESKMAAILAAFGLRIGADIEIVNAADFVKQCAAAPKLYGPGDTGRDRKSYYVTEDGIAVIDIFGPLVKRSSGDFLSGGPTTYGEIEQEFQDAIDDPNIKGLLLQMDSPGGECGGCFELTDVMYAQRGAKPIVTACDGDAFSAGYALASVADRIFVSKSGGVGSVGVWMMHADFSGALEEDKIKVTFIQYGARKIDGNPYQPLSEEAHGAFQAEVTRIGEMFAGAVARNRGMSAAAVKDTQAGLFFGPNGVAIGFADEVGTVADALASLRARVQSNAGSKAARSAAKTTQKGGAMKAEETTGSPAADETTQPPADEQEKKQQAAVGDARAEGFAQAKRIVGLCAVAGFSARKAQQFLRADATLEALQAEIVEARADSSDRETINSHILPDAGTEGNSAASLLGKAADRLAQQNAARKGER